MLIKKMQLVVEKMRKHGNAKMQGCLSPLSGF